MIQKMRKNQKGFTLIELMIVVAIIGILAAIAIPNFLQYQLKSKTAEAKVNLGAIKTNQEAYRAENDVYLVCAATPAAVPGTSKAAWAAGGIANFDSIGFSPAGDVYYQYAVAAIAAIATDFRASATGDLDGDAANAVSTLDFDGTAASPAAGVF